MPKKGDQNPETDLEQVPIYVQKLRQYHPIQLIDTLIETKPAACFYRKSTIDLGFLGFGCFEEIKFGDFFSIKLGLVLRGDYKVRKGADFARKHRGFIEL